MDVDTLQKDCDALGGLFQHIVADLKGSYPVWEDFLNKATKLQAVLRTTSAATGMFLDAFQKVADLANNSHGASREIGAALTRLCFRHRSVDNKLKTFASAIVEQLVEPLQGKLEEWKRTAVSMDKDHGREYKKVQQEIKKASQDLSRLRKRAEKGRTDAQHKLDQVLHDVTGRYQRLENSEKSTVRGAMIEERNRFCFFFNCLKPLLDIEIGMLLEVSHLQEIIDVLSGQVTDPTSMPQSGEQVINDLKGTDTNWTYQSPPSSPVLAPSSHLGSRKSSVGSISSCSSGSSTRLSLQSPSHHQVAAPAPLTASLSVNDVQMRCMRQLSSVSSQDSGFVSHDMPCFDRDQGCVIDFLKNSSSKTDVSGSNSSSPDRCGTSYVSSWSGSSGELKQPSAAGTFCPHAPNSWPNDRPHTISSSYERPHSRAPLTAQTFEAPSTPGHSGQSRPVSSMVYMMPSTVVQLRTADIYARPVLSGRRATLSRCAYPVMPPTAPVEYAVCSGGRGLAASIWKDSSILEEKGVDVDVAEERCLHRCSSLPSPTSGATEAAAPSGNVSVCNTDIVQNDALKNLCRQRRFVLNDDNYIMNTVTLCDVHKMSSPSRDFESVMDVVRTKQQPTLDEIGKSQTLPRFQPFKLPEVPHGTPSMSKPSNDKVPCSMQTRVRPPPPARRNSVRSELMSLATTEETTKLVDVTQQRDEQALSDNRPSPTQQATPADNAESLRLFPPPADLPVSVINSGDVQWPSTERSRLPPASEAMTCCECITDTASTQQIPPETNGCATSDNPDTGHSEVVAGSQITSVAVVDSTSDLMPANCGTLEMIRRGVKLRKTISNDRSAPRL